MYCFIMENPIKMGIPMDPAMPSQRKYDCTFLDAMDP